MKIVVHDTIDDLFDDMRAIAVKAPRELRGVVRDGVKAGNQVAKENAERSSGSHGKLYPRAFSWEMNSGAGLFGNVYSGEYGPDADKPQGGMSFEFGSRHQKPHLDLARSADLIGPSFAQEVGDVIDRLFW